MAHQIEILLHYINFIVDVIIIPDPQRTQERSSCVTITIAAEKLIQGREGRVYAAYNIKLILAGFKKTAFSLQDNMPADGSSPTFQALEFGYKTLNLATSSRVEEVVMTTLSAPHIRGDAPDGDLSTDEGPLRSRHRNAGYNP